MKSISSSKAEEFLGQMIKRGAMIPGVMKARTPKSSPAEKAGKGKLPSPESIKAVSQE